MAFRTVVLQLLLSGVPCCQSQVAIPTESQTGGTTSLSASAPLPPEIQQLINEIINDAAKSRLNSTVPSSDPNCIWPACSAHCDHCPKADAQHTCKAAGFQNCPVNSQCMIGACFCNTGTCLIGDTCKDKVCKMGAVPWRNRQADTAPFFLQFAPPIPAQTSTLADWKAWSLSCIKAPIVLLVLGCICATLIFWCLMCHLECDMPWLPKSPIILIALCIVTGIASGVSIGVRFRQVSSTVDKMDDRLSVMLTAALETRNIVDEVMLAKTAFHENLKALPETCVAYVPLAKQMVEKGTLSAEQKMVKLDKAIELVDHMLTVMIRNLRLAKEQVWLMHLSLTILPSVPLVFMVMGMFTIALAASISWCTHNPRTSELADRVVIQCGSFGIAISIILASILAASVFYSSIVTCGFCKNVDTNILNLAKQVDFEKLAKTAQTYPINPLVNGVLQYYLAGTRENPIHSLLTTSESMLEAMLAVYDTSQWAVKPASLACPGLDELQPGPLVETGKKCIALAKDKTHSAFVWPFYRDLVREILCREGPDTSLQLAITTLVIALIFYPMIAIIADIDLRKWADHKTDNHESFYGGFYDDHGDDYGGEHELLAKYDSSYEMAQRGYAGH